jgi:ribosomal protein S27AE
VEEVHDEELVVVAGDPCPRCGGEIVIAGYRDYTDIPVCRDGFDTDEGQMGDFTETDVYCKKCGQTVFIDWESAQ